MKKVILGIPMGGNPFTYEELIERFRFENLNLLDFIFSAQTDVSVVHIEHGWTELESLMKYVQSLCNLFNQDYIILTYSEDGKVKTIFVYNSVYDGFKYVFSVPGVVIEWDYSDKFPVC